MAAVDAPGGQEIGAGRTPRVHLRRRPERGLLGGVCAGIAERLQVPVAAVRLIAALTVGFGGVGVVLYSLAWALVPVAADSRGLPRRRGAWR
ncbi:MAG: PspC domain-containing protein, partial [Solirubrobacteraceae bacterium]